MKRLFLNLRVIFLLGPNFLILEYYLILKKSILDMAVNFKIGCISKTFGDKKFDSGGGLYQTRGGLAPIAPPSLVERHV